MNLLPIDLITHQAVCVACGKWKEIANFSNSQLSRRDQKAKCKQCVEKIVEQQAHKLAHQTGVYECVVCGKNLTMKAGVNLISDISRKHRKRSVCSDKCKEFFDLAIAHVIDLYAVHRVVAKDIVISKWLDRRINQYEKDIRVQARNASRNATA